MKNEWIKVAAPATTSNIGPGFDTFGLALKEPYDTIEGRITESGISVLEITGPGADSIPKEPERNSVCIAAEEVIRRSGEKFGIEFKIHKGIRPGSGLGSSRRPYWRSLPGEHNVRRKLNKSELVSRPMPKT